MERSSTSTTIRTASDANEDSRKRSVTDARQDGCSKRWSETNGKARTRMKLIDADRLIEWWKPDVGRMFYADNFIHTLEFAPTIKTKEIKYYDEDESVWKIGRVIVDD